MFGLLGSVYFQPIISAEEGAEASLAQV
jgi:hypothetical protein